jgi:hypothetical protein
VLKKLRHECRAYVTSSSGDEYSLRRRHFAKN